MKANMGAFLSIVLLGGSVLLWLVTFCVTANPDYLINERRRMLSGLMMRLAICLMAIGLCSACGSLLWAWLLIW